MEIDITDFARTACPRDYSASVAEIGNDAGAATWTAAVEDAPDYPILSTEEAREAAREFFASFGAWSDEEIAAWSDDELTALMLQSVSGDMRDYSDAPIAEWDWQEYESRAHAGSVSSRIFAGDDGRIYYHIGS
jgi:hypothetical protein